MSGFVQLPWSMPIEGYRWVEMNYHGDFKGHGPALAEVVTAGMTTETRTYAPLVSHPGLFRTFADTPETQQSIQSFANKYGSVFWTKDAMDLDVVRQHDYAGPTRPVGDSLARWQYEIRALRFAVALWDASKTAEEGPLSRLVRWQDTQHLTFRPGERWIPAPEFPESVKSWLVPGELHLPAFIYIQHEANRRLASTTSVSMLFDRSRDGLPIGLFLSPQDLISGLWLQLAQAITGNKDFRQCRQCGEWFEVHMSITRSDRAYCSNACRSKAYRQRKTQ